ncbi:MAG TPA: hypothetical protein VFG83_18500 [Kofleriaceae bacterium]|nr:hypothetical protein [Kofleriaceae bacterium]
MTRLLKVAAAIALAAAAAGLLLHAVPPVALGWLVMVLGAGAAIGLAGAFACRRAGVAHRWPPMVMAILGALFAVAIDGALDYRAWRGHAGDRAAAIRDLEAMPLGDSPAIRARYERALAGRDLGAFIAATRAGDPAAIPRTLVDAGLACTVAGVVFALGVRP